MKYKIIEKATGKDVSADFILDHCGLLRYIVLPSIYGVIPDKEKYSIVSETEPAFTFQVWAATSFWYAANNIGTYQILHKVFKDDPHLLQVTISIASRRNMDLFAAFAEYDAGIRGKIIRWILNNYDGVSLETVEAHYM